MWHASEATEAWPVGACAYCAVGWRKRGAAAARRRTQSRARAPEHARNPFTYLTLGYMPLHDPLSDPAVRSGVLLMSCSGAVMVWPLEVMFALSVRLDMALVSSFAAVSPVDARSGDESPLTPLQAGALSVKCCCGRRMRGAPVTGGCGVLL